MAALASSLPGRRAALPDGLPAEIDPDTADELYCWLEPALDRAHELLALLDRRAAEHWSDDEA